MAIQLDLRREEHLEIFKKFGPYSIHAEAYARGERVITMHDSGSSVAFRWDVDRLGDLAEGARVSVHVLKRALDR